MIRIFSSASRAASIFVFTGHIASGYSLCKRLFDGRASRAKLETKRQNTMHETRKGGSTVNDVRDLSPGIAFVVCDAFSGYQRRVTCMR